MSYQRVIDALQAHELSWDEIDRIELQSETYDEFQSRASFPTSSHATDTSPAVRKTTGTEQIIYVSEGGALVTVHL